MPFPIEPDARSDDKESDFLIQDPFGLRRAITPVFSFDLKDGMLTESREGKSEGLGTSFYVTPFGHQLSAMHVVTDFFNDRGASIPAGPTKTLINPDGSWIGIFFDPGLVYGARKAGEVLLATDFVMFPVDQARHPLAMTFTRDQLNHIEPKLDLVSWNISGLSERKTVFLPIRVASKPSIKKGDRVMAVGYPEIKSWRRPGAQLVSYQEQMRGSIGRVIELNNNWDQDRKIWPTMVVDVEWKAGMSGGPVFNENGEVVGIVSRGVKQVEGTDGWGSALWLEPLPYRRDIYGEIDPRRPGWIVGWGVCNNPTSMVELFQTEDAANIFAQKNDPRLTVREVSTPHPMKFVRPEQNRRR